ncbi:hypothetical protein J7M23_10235 [Candidatus Sumerlaeota bacterium]|nr:hypothetical protein [Candidatus Sumerlaeota bacterium]
MKIVGLIRDGCITISTIIGSCVALKGLSIWRKELKGKTEYELARRMLISAYKWKDAMEFVRNPFTFTFEYEDHPLDQINSNKTAQEEKYKEFLHIYENRLKPVVEAMRDLKIGIAEAKALWGEEMEEYIKPFRKCVSKFM